MTLYRFSSYPVVDANGGRAIGATGNVYARTDTAFANPLPTFDSAGVPIVLTSNSFAMLPEFDVDHDEMYVVWKSGDLPTATLISVTGVVDTAIASQVSAAASQVSAANSQLAAESAASSAASLAAGVVRKINGLSPNSEGEITITGTGGGSGGTVTSVAGKTGDVSLVKADVGLSNVNNTSDADKPVSDDVQAALDLKANTVHTHAISNITNLQNTLDSKRGVNDAIAASLIQSGVIAPERLGTGTSIATKFLRGDGTWQTPAGGGTGAVDSVNGQTGVVELDAADVGALPDTYVAPVLSVAGLTGTVLLNKTHVGLGNVDNTTDLLKPLSNDAVAALALKANDNVVVKTSGNQSVGGTKTFTSAPVVPDGSFTTAKVVGLPAALGAILAAAVGSSVTLTHYWVGTAAAYNAMATPRSATTLYIKVG